MGKCSTEQGISTVRHELPVVHRMRVHDASNVAREAFRAEESEAASGARTGRFA